jgi:hypothetical protein
MKTLIISTLVVIYAQAAFAQKAWKEDWRTYSIEEVIKLTSRGLRDGWTDAKVLELFGQPDEGTIAKQFGVTDAGLTYKLNSGLTLRIFKDKSTDTKQYPVGYFATFQLLDLKARKDEVIIWTTNHSRKLTKEEEEERRAKYDGLPEYRMFPALPPTDMPSTTPGEIAS